MVGRTFKRAISAIVCAIVVLSVAICGNAQIAKKLTNPYTAKRLQDMQHRLSPLPSFSAADKLKAYKTSSSIHARSGANAIPRYSRAVPSSSAVAPSLNFPGLYAAPYVSAHSLDNTYGAYASEVADFDGQNGPDVVTVQLDGTLNLLTNDGKGNLTLTYSNSAAVSLSPLVVYIEVADLNKDGHPDVVAEDSANSALLVYLNKGDGTFVDPTSVSVTPASGAAFWNGGSFTIADVNGDGIPDIVTITGLQDWNSYTTVFSQQTFLGVGNGTFLTPAQSTDTNLRKAALVFFGHDIAITDLNGDGKKDLVVEYFDGIYGWVTVAPAFGKGNGTFDPISTGVSILGLQQANGIETLINPKLQIADLNGDGTQDVLFTFGDGYAYVALGKGDGTLKAPTVALDDVPTIQNFQLGDFNKDGYLDLLAFNAQSTAVFAGRGDGTFNRYPLGRFGGSDSGDQEPAPADFNGDGNLDFVQVDTLYGVVSIYKGFGDGTFLAQRSIAPSNNSETLPSSTQDPFFYKVIAVSDINGDGKTDVLGADLSKTWLFMYPDVNLGISDGKGGFNFTTVLKGESDNGHDLDSLATWDLAPVLADFNKDGHPDLLLEAGGGLMIALSNADGTLNPATHITLPVETDSCAFDGVDVGDVNKDGNLDIVWAYNGQNNPCGFTGATGPGVFVLLGDGKGGFTARFNDFGTRGYRVKLADFNGDGLLDLVLDDGYQFSVGTIIPSTVYVLPGKADGTFDTASAQTVLSGWRIEEITLGDFDGDGVQDLTLASEGQVDGNGNILPQTQGVLLLRGRGDFTFESPLTVAPGVFAAHAEYADLNNDGLSDLMISVTKSYEDFPTYYGLAVLQNQGDGRFAAPQFYLQPQSGSSLQPFVGDFNGDGALDIMVAPDGGAFYNGWGTPSTLFLNRGGSTVSLTADPGTVRQGENVVLRASVSTMSGTPEATGSINFYVNGSPYGVAGLHNGLDSELVESNLPVGTNTITAIYTGDANHNPSRAASASVTVKALAPSFAVSATPQTLTLGAGQSGNVALNFTANATFNGKITVTCSGLPSSATCSLSPANLTLAPGDTGTITATISVAGSTHAANNHRSAGWIAGCSLALLPGMLLMWPTRRRKATQMLGTCMVIMLCLALSFSLVGCGGGSSSRVQTPAGNSVVTITATASSGGTAIQQTALVSLTIR